MLQTYNRFSAIPGSSPGTWSATARSSTSDSADAFQKYLTDKRLIVDATPAKKEHK